LVKEKIVPAAIRKRLPFPVKHPLLALAGWQWRARGLPSQSPGDIAIFKSVLSSAGGQSLRVLEWGSGASTIYYARFLVSIGREFEWHAIDNSRVWYERVQGKTLQNNLAGRVRVHCSEFPAFWELPGYSPDSPVPPDSYTSSASILRYVELPRELGANFDVVFVDGRFRRRCLLVAKEVLAHEGVVILHDAQRSHYHPSLSYYPHVQFLETGVLPGSNAKSTIALCSLDNESFIYELANKYRSLPLASWQAKRC